MRSAAPLPFVAQPVVSGPRVDPVEACLSARRVPCICPAQHDGATGASMGYSRSRGTIVEHVACRNCPRTWTRVNAR